MTAILCVYILGTEDLTREEKESIADKWGKVIPYLDRGYIFYQAMKTLDKFSSDYLPASYYSPIIEDTLNPLRSKLSLSHKSLTEIIYGGIVKFPDTILRSFNGIYFNNELRPLTKDVAASILDSCRGEALLYKPALATCQGKGISIIDSSNWDHIVEMTGFGTNLPVSDFVIQRFVDQSPFTKRFNPSSLNCMRITTLNLNGKVSVCSRAIKFGPVNSIVDNIGTGKRGIAVGLLEDGSLCEYGFYGNGEKGYSHNDVIFKGNIIPNFNKVLETAKRLHSVNSECKLIGWDLALDSNNDVVLIEGNTVCPSISFEQMATGPIFGERTDEVINYIFSQKNKG